jgi:hypothetical protein
MLKQTTPERCTLVVEAANEKEAERLALEQCKDADWRRDESIGVQEVTDVLIEVQVEIIGV